jgi:GH43 family beta-xylosidase
MRKIPLLLLSAFSLQLSVFGGEDASAVVFVGEQGAISSAAEFSAAFAQLPAAGGTIVLRGPVRLGENFSASAHAARVIITSVHDGKDHRASGAELVIGGALAVGGPIVFENITFAPASKTPRIFCEGKQVVFGNGLACRPATGGKFPSIDGTDSGGADVTVNSGEWAALAGGTHRDGAPTSGALRVTINGGCFHDPVCAAGSGRHTGAAALTLNGGDFLGGVAVLGKSARAAFRGNAVVTVNNGVFYNTIAVSRHAEAEFAGSYALAIKGGDFTSVTDVTGVRGLRGGAASTLAAPAALLDRPNAGALTFVNPLIPGADPWVFLHDGFYYATVTSGSQLEVRKVANLPDLPGAEPVVIYKPAPGKPWSRNLWSPKIYQFTEAEVGVENSGWYLYLSANDGSGTPAQDQRMFVLRSLSGTPLGPYGAATGDRKPHTATRATAAAKGSLFNKNWCSGAKILKHAGKLYAIYVSEVGDKFSKNTGDRYQIICIDRLVNPWTLAGEAVVINRPTLAWEKRGAGPGKRGMYPEVVEGGTPVHAADGTLYLLYAGSGYWTPHYAIGVMKLIGADPVNPAHWQKRTQPIFKASDEVVGTGNACYVSSPTGKSTWAIYHAYVGKKIRGVPRQLFAEPYVADANSVTIGRGTPLPLGTPLEIEANPMPLRQKISAFTTAP